MPLGRRTSRTATLLVPMLCVSLADGVTRAGEPNGTCGPRLVALRPGVHGPYDKRIVHAISGARAPQLAECLEPADAIPTGEPAQIDVEYHLDGKGNVLDAGVAASDFRDEVDACVRERVLAWKFPAAPRKGSIVVRQTFAVAF